MVKKINKKDNKFILLTNRALAKNEHGRLNNLTLEPNTYHFTINSDQSGNSERTTR